MNIQALIREAMLARENAYAPYSGFLVGAALLSENGKVYRGCNVENAAFSPSNCAERTALFSAICDGVRRFQAIAVVGAPRTVQEFSFCFPCGVCRQTLSEFCAPDFVVIVARSENDYETHTLDQLLPHCFGRADIVR